MITIPASHGGLLAILEPMTRARGKKDRTRCLYGSGGGGGGRVSLESIRRLEIYVIRINICTNTEHVTAVQKKSRQQLHSSKVVKRLFSMYNTRQY